MSYINVVQPPAGYDRGLIVPSSSRRRRGPQSIEGTAKRLSMYLLAKLYASDNYHCTGLRLRPDTSGRLLVKAPVSGNPTD